jgi:hypothetical protein
MYRLHILLKKAALSLDDGLHLAMQVLATMALSMEAKFPLKGQCHEIFCFWFFS